MAEMERKISEHEKKVNTQVAMMLDRQPAWSHQTDQSLGIVGKQLACPMEQ